MKWFFLLILNRSNVIQFYIFGLQWRVQRMCKNHLKSLKKTAKKARKKLFSKRQKDKNSMFRRKLCRSSWAIRDWIKWIFNRFITENVIEFAIIWMKLTNINWTNCVFSPLLFLLLLQLSAFRIQFQRHFHCIRCVAFGFFIHVKRHNYVLFCYSLIQLLLLWW